jgi:hypothetical protein
MTERLRKERDGMSQTMERLRSECNMACMKRDMAYEEHNAAQQQIGSL